MNNISEGLCRYSDAEFRHLLSISKGSSGEVKNMYYVAEDQSYISGDIAENRRERSEKLINSIGKLMSYLKNNHKSLPDTKTHRHLDSKTPRQKIIILRHLT